MDSPLGELCSACDGKGCTIYGRHPDDCKNFKCMYAQSENVPIDLRPDNCGIVFEKVDTDLVFGLLFAEKMSDRIKAQIEFFNGREDLSVVVQNYPEGKRTIWPMKGKTTLQVNMELINKRRDFFDAA